MYAEEYLPSDAINDDDISVTIDDLSTINSDIIEELRMLKAYKKADSNYYSFKTRFGEDLEKIEVYASPNNGKIRHAISGFKTHHMVSSASEDLYFTVVDSSCLAKRDTNNRRKLYYNNPEEYERHFITKLSQDIKQRWVEKSLNARMKRRK